MQSLWTQLLSTQTVRLVSACSRCLPFIRRGDVSITVEALEFQSRSLFITIYVSLLRLKKIQHQGSKTHDVSPDLDKQTVGVRVKVGNVADMLFVFFLFLVNHVEGANFRLEGLMGLYKNGCILNEEQKMRLFIQTATATFPITMTVLHYIAIQHMLRGDSSMEQLAKLSTL